MSIAKTASRSSHGKMRGPYRIRGLLGVDIREAAVLTGFSVKSLRVRVHKGVIPYRRSGGRILFDPEDLRLWLRQLPGVTVDQALRRQAEQG
jgi:excisionase family DNA binding protein